MKKIIFTLICLSLCFTAIGQGITKDSSGCDLMKNIKFKNGVDTLEFSAIYWAKTPQNQEYLLKLLAEKKQILLDEYLDEDDKGGSLEFMLINCNKRFQATLSRKIYDKPYIIKGNNINDYLQAKVNLNDLHTYQKIYLKCVVFEQPKVRNKRGGYFFTIIDLRTL